MQNKKVSNKQRIQVGGSSLLLIFTILCLVIFGTLSMSSARVDYGLAQKNHKNVETYYEVDGKGEELKRDINNELIKLREVKASQNEFIGGVKESFGEAFDETTNKIKYTIDADSEQFLLIEVQVDAYEEIATGKENFSVLCWVIQNKEDYVIDESMNVWDGL